MIKLHSAVTLGLRRKSGVMWDTLEEQRAGLGQGTEDASEMETLLTTQQFCSRGLGFALHFPSAAPQIKTPWRELTFPVCLFEPVFLSPAGERGAGLGQHLRPEHHEHGEGARVPPGRRAGRAVGELALHRLLPLRGGAGVPGTQSHPGRLVPQWGTGLGFTMSLKEASALLLTAEL